MLEGRGIFDELTIEKNRWMGAFSRADHTGLADDLARAEIADHGYVMETGKIVLEEPAAELKHDRNIREFYLSRAVGDDRRRYTELKFYKRRKRWTSS